MIKLTFRFSALFFVIFLSDFLCDAFSCQAKDVVMSDSIFRYYDIRGKVGTDFQTDDVYSIAKALAYYFNQKSPEAKKVAIGMDGRIHSPAIKEQIVRAMNDSGFDVIYIGMCATPVLYYTLFTQDVDAGIMITASHNGPEYNGLKICLNKKPVAMEQMWVLRDMWRKGNQIEGAAQGSYCEKMMNPIYLDFLCEHFSHLKNRDIPLAIDCGSGATATVMPELVARMGWQNATLLFDEIDGSFSKHLPDPTIDANVKDLRKYVIEHNCLGVAFDGDGDRMVPMTLEGDLVPGDKMLALYAQKVMENHSAFPVVFDVKSSSKLVDLLHSWGLNPIMSATGHSLIKQAIHKNKALVAGEISCHFFFADRYYGFDDGIYALMRLVEILVEGDKDFKELLTIFPPSVSTPEIRISCQQGQDKQVIDAVKKWYAVRKDVSVTTLDGARVVFANGWGLVRGSNTEPSLSLRFEAEDSQALEEQKNEFVQILSSYIDPKILNEKFNV